MKTNPSSFTLATLVVAIYFCVISARAFGQSDYESFENSDFLTADQKRDILYNNAARFFRLTEEEIAKHHND